MGMSRAGNVYVTGVDIEHQPEHPAMDMFHAERFGFLKASIFNLSLDYIREFDFVWASPPCQAYSYAAHRWRNSGRTWPDLLARTRTMLEYAGVPFVIENVAGAPMRKDLMLCGEMFGLKVLRHRYFELHDFFATQPDHIKHRGMVKDGHYVTVAGNGGDYAGHNFCTLQELPGANQLRTWQFAMGINWISSKKTLREAVPPSYSEYILREFIQQRGE